MPAKFLNVLGFIFILGVATAQAEPPETPSPDESSLEFLEFLGEFDAGEEEWIDPEELEQMTALDSGENAVPEPDNEKDNQ